MSQDNKELTPKWYVVHTYSGYENKVKTDLEKTVKNRELEEYFFDIVVPMEEQIEIKDGQRKANLKKVIWPTPKQLVNNTVAVVVIVLITAAIVFVLDAVFDLGNKYGITQLQSIVNEKFNSEENHNHEEENNEESTSTEGEESTEGETTNDENTTTENTETPVENSEQ